MNKRRLVRDRLNRRKARAKKRGQQPLPLGTATLPTATVIDLADALTSVAVVLADADQPHQVVLTPLEQQLVYNLRNLHQALHEALRLAADELVEADRDTSQYQHEYKGKRPKFARDD